MVNGNERSEVRELSFAIQAGGGVLLFATGIAGVALAVDHREYAFIGLAVFMAVTGAVVAWVNSTFFLRARSGRSYGPENLKLDLGPLAQLLIPAAFLTLLAVGFIPAALERRAYILVAIIAALYLYIVPYMIRKYFSDRRKDCQLPKSPA
jgi:hypothetical protein